MMYFEIFIISQFNYCPLIWRIITRGLNNKITNIYKQESFPYIQYRMTMIPVLKILIKTNTIHLRNLQQLAKKNFKAKHGIAPMIMNKIFTFVEKYTYNLRSGMHFSRVNVYSTQYGTESIGNLGEKNLSLFPVHIKDFKALGRFKNQIKK